MTQDSAMSPDDSYLPDPQQTIEREQEAIRKVARAISRKIEGREMYWKDYTSAAEAAIEAFRAM